MSRRPQASRPTPPFATCGPPTAELGPGKLSDRKEHVPAFVAEVTERQAAALNTRAQIEQAPLCKLLDLAPPRAASWMREQLSINHNKGDAFSRKI